jgi:hypothetical protein
MRLRVVLLFLILGAALAGCGVAAEPLAFGPVPWQSGETSEYNVLVGNGELAGTASWTWETMDEGWRLTWMVELATRTDIGVVELGADLYPLRSELALPASYHTATYGPEQIEMVISPAEGEPTTRTLGRPGHPIDNGQSLQVHRALPLADGYATRYTNVIPTTGLAANTLIRVEGRENIPVPAGTFDTWHLVMTTGGRSHDAWYAVEPPHHMVRYRNRAAGSDLVLRRWRPGPEAPWETGPEP